LIENSDKYVEKDGLKQTNNDGKLYGGKIAQA
jgi:hypothetical protein